MPVLAGIFQAVPDAFESVWNFFYAGKLFMVFLLALSLLSIGVILVKAFDLRRRHVLPDEAEEAIRSAPPHLTQREIIDLTTQLRASESVLGRLGLMALSGEHADKADASRAVEARAREEIVELESGVALLEVVITIAPLLGLLGTVSGLVSVFSNLGDSAEHSAIAIGIAEALNTTIAGLAIAVPTVVAHSFFMKKIEKMAVRMEILVGGLLAKVFRSAAGGAAPPPTPAIPAAEVDLYADDEPVGAEVPETDPEPAAATVPGFPRLLAGHGAAGDATPRSEELPGSAGSSAFAPEPATDPSPPR